MPIIEFRHFIRHPLCLPLSYKVFNQGLKRPGKKTILVTVNVSGEGLLFPSKHSIKPGVRILIKMPFEDKLFNIRAKVVRSVHNPLTKFYDIAVSFPKTQEAFKVKMVEQIYLIAEYRDLRNLRKGQIFPLKKPPVNGSNDIRKNLENFTGSFFVYQKDY